MAGQNSSSFVVEENEMEEREEEMEDDEDGFERDQSKSTEMMHRYQQRSVDSHYNNNPSPHSSHHYSQQ